MGWKKVAQVAVLGAWEKVAQVAVLAAWEKVAQVAVLAAWEKVAQVVLAAWKEVALVVVLAAWKDVVLAVKNFDLVLLLPRTEATVAPKFRYSSQCNRHQVHNQHRVVKKCIMIQTCQSVKQDDPLFFQKSKVSLSKN